MMSGLSCSVVVVAGVCRDPGVEGVIHSNVGQSDN